MPLDDHPQTLPVHHSERDHDSLPLTRRQHLLFLLLLVVLSVPSLVGYAVIVRWLWRLFRTLAHCGVIF